MKYSLRMVVAQKRYKALRLQQQLKKNFQSEFPLLVYKSIPIFGPILQNKFNNDFSKTF